MLTKPLTLAPLTMSLAACGGGSEEAEAEVDTEVVHVSAPNVGMGVDQLTYWDSSFAVADVVRQSRFLNFNWGAEVDADGKGASGQSFYLMLSSRRLGVVLNEAEASVCQGYF